jgi:hypothetical protein
LEPPNSRQEACVTIRAGNRFVGLSSIRHMLKLLLMDRMILAPRIGEFKDAMIDGWWIEE